MQEQEYDHMRPVLSAEGIKSRRSSPVVITPVVEALDLNVSPLDAYLGLKKLGNRSFLFESADLGGKSARFSFVGTTESTIAIKDGIIYLNGSKESYPGGPMALLKDTLAGFRPAAPVFVGARAQMPVFYGGLAGYLSYDLIRYFDHIGESACDDIGCMDAELVFASDMVAFDHANKKALLISNAIGHNGIDAAKHGIERMKAAIKGAKPAVQLHSEPVELSVTYGTSKETVHGNGRARQGVYPGRRRVPDRPLPAHGNRRGDRPNIAVHDAERDQPVALHVPPGVRRHGCRGLQPGNTGEGGGQEDHRQADRGNAPARENRSRRTPRWRRR